MNWPWWVRIRPWRWIGKMRSMLGFGIELAVGPWYLAIRIHPLRWLRPRASWAGRSWLAQVGPISVEFDDYTWE